MEQLCNLALWQHQQVKRDSANRGRLQRSRFAERLVRPYPNFLQWPNKTYILSCLAAWQGKLLKPYYSKEFLFLFSQYVLGLSQDFIFSHNHVEYEFFCPASSKVLGQVISHVFCCAEYMDLYNLTGFLSFFSWQCRDCPCKIQIICEK